MKNENLFVLIILAFVGLTLSMYLAYMYSLPQPVVCLGHGENTCEIVRNSSESYFLGIRMPFWGIFYFASFISVATLYLVRAPFEKLLNSLLVFMLISGFIFESYKTWIQIFVLRAVCVWCTSIEIVLLLMCVWYIFTSKKKKTDTSPL